MGDIDERALEDALERADIGRLAEEDGVRLTPAQGVERRGKCPRAPGACSSQSDAFRVSHHAGRNRWYCRKCTPRGGDALDYLRTVRGMPWADAVRELERITGVSVFGTQGKSASPWALTPRRPVRCPLIDEELGVELPAELYEPPAPAWQAVADAFVRESKRALWGTHGTAALAYLSAERMINGSTIDKRELGVNFRARELAPGVWAPAGYVIPHRYAGDLWRIRVRRFEGAKQSKYLLVSGAGENKGQLYNGDELERRPKVPAVLCGGEFDALVLGQAVPGVVCVTMGSETQRPTWEALYLLRERPVYIAFDSDAAGDNGGRAWLAALRDARVLKPPAHDITDAARAGVDLSAWLADIWPANTGISRQNGRGDPWQSMAMGGNLSRMR